MIEINGYTFDESLYYYTRGDGHIWVQLLEDGNVKIGFDDFGQQLAGKILFVRTISEGREREQGSSLGTIETGKYVGALRCPLSGIILKINSEVKENPELINTDPYRKGWIAIIEPNDLEKELKIDMVYGKEGLKKWIADEIETHAPE
jgi:glycine cleavage system H protein